MKRAVLLFAATLGTGALYSSEPTGTPPNRCTPVFADLSGNVPQAIARTSRERVEGEFPASGEVTPDLSQLGEGEYVFLIGRKAGSAEAPVLVWARRVPDLSVDPDSGKPFLATHRGLAQTLAARVGAQGPEGIEILGAGEVIREGRMIEVNNASGTYPGESAHLEFSEQVLGAHGLARDKITRRTNHGDEDTRPDAAHTSVVASARRMLTHLANPAQRAQREQLVALRGRLADRFPDPDGSVNVRELRSAVSRQLRYIELAREEALTNNYAASNRVYAVLEVIRFAYGRDGVDYALFQMRE